MTLVDLYASVITGFESVARREVERQLHCSSCRQERGSVRFEVEQDSIPVALKLRSVDNLYVLVYDEDIDGLCTMDEQSALQAIQQQLPRVNWAQAVECWQTARGRTIHGGSQLVKDQMKSFVTDSSHHDVTEDSPTFRDSIVTCNRAGEKSAHSFSSMDAARAFGAQLNNVFGWKPDMKHYDMEVVLGIRGQSMRIMVALNEETMFKRNVCSYGPTTMRSTMCYCMLALAQPKPGELIVDAMCGGGSIPLEGVLAFPQSLFIGGDNHPKALERCAENKNNNIDSLNGRVLDFFSWNATRLPFRDSSVDAIVTDLPFGRKIGSVVDNRVLYPQLAAEWLRVVRPGGRLVVMTHDKRSWENSLRSEPLRDCWRPSASHMVNVGGLSVMCSLLINMKDIKPT